MKKQIKKIKENKGFSMIELIIVVAIMAILVGIIGAALIPYMEKSRASKDKSTLDAVYTAFGTVVSETEDAENNLDTIIDDDSQLWELAGATDRSDLEGKFKSKQFKGATIEFFLEDEKYGVYIEGQGDYTGVQIDNSGAEHKVGVKGDNSKTAEGSTLGVY